MYYRLAESYRLYQDYINAEEWYSKVIGENYPLARLWYGVCLRANSHFDEAVKHLQQFAAGYQGDPYYIELAKREIAVCTFAKEQYQGYAVATISKMSAPWNADGGDYGLLKNNNNYWFTSSRFVQGGATHLNNIYTVAIQKNATPVALNIKAGVKEKGIEYGAISMSATGRRMYLTRWQKIDSMLNLAIYKTDQVNGAWSAPQKLNNQVNVEGFNALQPFITGDCKRLFFASDRPGGQGGYDIWVSNLDSNGSPVDAINLGSTINTPFDEQSPHYDEEDNQLIYSSKGFIGMGGFDLFKSTNNNGQWSVPANLGYPVNSSKDDIYYYPDPEDKDKFYISSDRESECCLNLFEGRYKHHYILGLVVDCDMHQYLQGVKVKLLHSLTKKLLKELETGDNGKYIFEVNIKHDYALSLEKQGYFTKVIPVQLKMGIDTLINPEICLQQFKVNKPIEIKNILYDFDKASLRPESKIALDTLVNIMRDNPVIKIELSSHTDSVGSDTYNMKLSQQRAQSCVDYIIEKGISKDRITAKGYGESIPKVPNSLPNGQDDPAGRQMNRRTEFTIKLK